MMCGLRGSAGGMKWIKATTSMGCGACVELARDGTMIALRDSKNPEVPPLRYTMAEIAAFLDGVRKGEFDHLIDPPAETSMGA
jgi:hypothetical protein